jgi:uncharacterized protein YkwD
MSLTASQTPAKLSQGLNSKSFTASSAVSKAIKTNSASNNNSENSPKENSNQASVNSSFAVSFQAVSKERTSISSAALDQSNLSQAISSFGSKFSALDSSSASSSQPKSSWLSGGAVDPESSKNNSRSEPESNNNGSNRSQGQTVPDLPKLPEKHTGETDPLVPNPEGIKLTQSEFDVIRYTNKLRQMAGKDPLIVKQNLTDTADLSSDRMKAKGQMVHGLTSGWNGENIAKGQRSAEEVVNSWKNSPGHYKNMMGNFQYIGVGDTQDREGSVYWTQQFS